MLAAACASQAPGDEAEVATASELSGDYPVGTPLVTTASVNLRESASGTATVLTVLEAGTRVLSASAHPKDGWYGVTTSGTTGWVNAAYLSRDVAVPAQPATSSGTYSRQQVYSLLADRVHGSGSASDVLDPGLTTQQLVNAIGWLATHSPPDWGFSVINSGHHYDPLAHSGGFALDFFANNAADDARFISLVNQDPYFVEIGVSGDYASLRSGISDSNKCSFVENAPTHVHASVRGAFCSNP